MIDSVQIREWDDTNGTRNKEVTITAEASDVPYTCVAAEVPGLGDQEYATSITLYAPVEESTVEDSTTILSTEKSANQRDRHISKNSLMKERMCVFVQPPFHIWGWGGGGGWDGVLN